MRISLITPLDQPLGTKRLLGELQNSLESAEYEEFYIMVAYAKSGPLHRLRSYIDNWKRNGKSIHAIIGIDQQGTSKEALELSLQLFDNVYITNDARVTFHPKTYLFKGPTAANVFVGSNNLTVGGTESNFEAAICIELDLPADNHEYEMFHNSWTDLLPANCVATRELTIALLEQLCAEKSVVSETEIRRARGRSASTTGHAVGVNNSDPKLPIKPPSPLPRSALAPVVKKKVAVKRATKKGKPAVAKTKTAVGNSFAIQIKPHHNGEIFLSVTAALQNPDFFNWPFNGLTTPKKPGNPAYPQLDPDPLVNINVYGAGAVPILSIEDFGLNTVFYEKNDEIRITASQLVDVVPEYSVMIMEKYVDDEHDYIISIHTPDSPEYENWVNTCNQEMPGGGKTPRKFGWF